MQSVLEYNVMSINRGWGEVIIIYYKSSPHTGKVRAADLMKFLQIIPHTDIENFWTFYTFMSEV